LLILLNCFSNIFSSGVSATLVADGNNNFKSV
jgi:hypothetical protein